MDINQIRQMTKEKNRPKNKFSKFGDREFCFCLISTQPLGFLFKRGEPKKEGSQCFQWEGFC